MVRVFPTDYTNELKRFSEDDDHVRGCIDSLFKDGVNPTDMFLEGLIRQFSDHWTEDDDVELALGEIDRLRDDFEDTLVPHLERCIYEGTLNIVRYGFTPLGYKKIEENGKEQRIVPYIPGEFVIVRLQPWGEYVCQGLDLDLDGGGPMELYFFRTLTDEERPNSDLAMLLPLYKKLKLARQVHDRALILASRPYIVTTPVLESKERDHDLFDDEKRERQKTKLRERMLRDQVNDGSSTALRLVELANLMSSSSSSSPSDGGNEELSGNGFMASVMRRTHQEMADKLYTLKTRHHREREDLKRKVRASEDLLQRYIVGQTTGEAIDLPLRYQLPEGSSHVGSHLNVRPNALGYELIERWYHLQVQANILSKESTGRVGNADRRQGVARSLVAAVDHLDETSVSPKSVILQRFFIHVVLSKWLTRENLPMAPVDPIQRSMNLNHFHLMDRILREGRMKLWLMCNTGHRAADISMEYRQNDPYRTGQAILVPQPVVPIATATTSSSTAATAADQSQSQSQSQSQVPITEKRKRDDDDDDSDDQWDDDDDDDDEDDEDDHEKRPKRRKRRRRP